MATFKNSKTGIVVQTENLLGSDWVEMKPETEKKVPVKAPSKKSAGK